MSNFGAAKDSAAQKADETKGATQDAAGTTQNKAQGVAGAAGDKANEAKKGILARAGEPLAAPGNVSDEGEDIVGNVTDRVKAAINKSGQ